MHSKNESEILKKCDACKTKHQEQLGITSQQYILSHKNFNKQVFSQQGHGAKKFFDTLAPALLLFNKLWLQLQIGSGNFTFQFEF